MLKESLPRRSRRTQSKNCWLFSAFSACSAVSLGFFSTPLTAQEKPAAATKVSLGFAYGSPGATVTIPLSLEGAGGKNVGRVVSQVKFPASHLSFVRLERAALLDSGIETVSQVREPDAKSSDPKSDRTEKTKVLEKILEVRISSKAEGTPLLDGILAYLVFQIAPGAGEEKSPEIPLAYEARIFAYDVTDKATPLAMVSDQTKILVAPRALIACFFYMH